MLIKHGSDLNYLLSREECGETQCYIIFKRNFRVNSLKIKLALNRNLFSTKGFTYTFAYTIISTNTIYTQMKFCVLLLFKQLRDPDQLQNKHIVHSTRLSYRYLIIAFIYCVNSIIANLKSKLKQLALALMTYVYVVHGSIRDILNGVSLSLRKT